MKENNLKINTGLSYYPMATTDGKLLKINKENTEYEYYDITAVEHDILKTINNNE